MLILGHKAGLDVGQTQAQLPRLATLPFDPTYKMMATFHEAKDASGKSVVRCYMKGAAPAVTERAAAALSNGASIPWDADLRTKSDSHVVRMEKAGLRVMGAAVRDLDPSTFDPRVICWITCKTYR